MAFDNVGSGKYELDKVDRNIVVAGDSLSKLLPLTRYLRGCQVVTGRGCCVWSEEKHGKWWNCFGQQLTDALTTKPSHLVLHLGTNNISSGHSVDRVVSEFRALLDYVWSTVPNTKVVISSVLPRSEDRYQDLFGQFNCVHLREIQADIRSTNLALKKLAATDVRSEFLDNTSTFYGFGGMRRDCVAYDGLHINVVGAEQLAKNMRDALANLPNDFSMELDDDIVWPLLASTSTAKETSTKRTNHSECSFSDHQASHTSRSELCASSGFQSCGGVESRDGVQSPADVQSPSGEVRNFRWGHGR